MSPAKTPTHTHSSIASPAALCRMGHPAAVTVKEEEEEDDDEVVVVLDADADADTGGRAAAAPAPEPWQPPAAPAVPAFVAKTFELVEDPATDGVVSWPRGARRGAASWCGTRTPSRRSSCRANFSTFLRQLSTYVRPR